MDTQTAIRERRSVKHYDPEHRMSDEEITQLLELASLSPSSFNIQHWRFVVVKDPSLREKIREASWGQAQVTDASLLLILCADIKAWEKDAARYWKGAAQEVQDMLVPMIGKFYASNEQAQLDECQRSCGIVSQTIMLAAKSMGYDTCPMVGFDPVKVAELVKLPKDHLISMFIVVGKALKPAQSRGGVLPLSELVVEDTF